MEKFLFDNIFLSTKEKHPDWFEEMNLPVKNKDINIVESLLKIKLPDDYSYFLKKYGSGMVGFTMIYNVIPSKYCYIVEENLNNNILKFLGISDNGCGDLYGYKLDNNINNKIYFWDHEENIISYKFEDIFEYICICGLNYKIYNH